MAKYIDADLLRKEIERRMEEYNIQSLRGAELSDLLSFIDSLQQEQQEVDLEKEVETWYGEYAGNSRFDWNGFARHFYELGKQAKQDAPEGLDEAMKQYLEGWDVATNIEKGVARAAFIAGAEWQKSQMPMPEDTVLFNKGVQEGRRLEREDMLKDAVEGEVMTNGFYPYEPRIVAPYPNCPYDFGDKVRIVVLKAEEE